MKHLTKITLIIFIGIIANQNVSALCLKDCDGNNQSNSSPMVSSKISKEEKQAKTVDVGGNYSRERSHDMNNVKNSIIGDVNVKSGHENVTVKNVTSKDAQINNSINNTFVFGDVKQ